MELMFTNVQNGRVTFTIFTTFLRFILCLLPIVLILCTTLQHFPLFSSHLKLFVTFAYVFYTSWYFRLNLLASLCHNWKFFHNVSPRDWHFSYFFHFYLLFTTFDKFHIVTVFCHFYLFVIYFWPLFLTCCATTRHLILSCECVYRSSNSYTICMVGVIDEMVHHFQM